jgi:hypothetical protein
MWVILRSLADTSGERRVSIALLLLIDEQYTRRASTEVHVRMCSPACGMHEMGRGPDDVLAGISSVL